MILDKVALGGIVSTEQNVVFYNYIFDSVTSNSVNATVIGLASFDNYTGLLSSFLIESFETTRGRIESFSECSCYLAEYESTITSFVYELEPVYSITSVINYKETVRYEIFDGPTYSYIGIPYQIRFLGDRLLDDSRYQIANTDMGMLLDVQDTYFSGVFHGAIRSKSVGYKQLFMPAIGESNDQYSVSLQQYDIFTLPVNNALISDFRAVNYILLPTVYRSEYWNNQPIPYSGTPVANPIVQPGVIDIDTIYSSSITLVYLPKFEDYYSELMTFRSFGDEFGFELMPLTTVPHKDNLEPVISNELSMINILRSSISDESIPYLTSNEDKGYSLSSKYSVHGSYPLKNMFNGNIDNPTIYTSYRNGDIIIELPEVQRVNSYSVGVGGYSNATIDSPESWTFSASMDGNEFFDYDIVDLNRQMNRYEVISRLIPKQPYAKYIKVKFSHDGYGGSWTRIGLLDIIFVDKSYAYRITDIEPYYSLPFIPQIDIFTPNDYISLPEYKIAIATWIDHKDYRGIIKDIGNLRISSIETTSLYGLTLDYVSFSMTDVPDTVVSLSGFISPYMILQAGVKEDTRKDGLYKGVYVDSHQVRVHSNTPWLKSNGSIVHIGNSEFYDISFEGSKISVYLLDDSKNDVILLDWRPIFINNSNWEMPQYRTSPYIRVDSSTGDFIVIALSVTGGSVVHMHLSGFLDTYSYGEPYYIGDEKLIKASSKTRIETTVDPYSAEAYSSNVSSSIYRKSAKIIKDTIDGLTYEQYIIDDAVSVIEKFEYSAAFFDEISCNPIVLDSIIKNKTKGMIDKELFTHDGAYEYNGIRFIHYEDESIPALDGIFSYTVYHEDKFVTTSDGFLDIDFTNVSISDMNLPMILEPCGAGTRCHNSIVYGFSIDAAISLEFKITRTADIVGNLLMTGGHIEPVTYHLDKYGELDIAPILFHNFVEVSLPKNYDDIITQESNLTATIGTYYGQIMYPGSLKIGLLELDGISSHKSNFSMLFPDTVLGDAYADFNMILSIHTRNDVIDGLYSEAGVITVDEGFVNMDDFFDRVPSIWMKMFFPSPAGKSEIEATIMGFNITDQYFAKGFNIPYVYVDEPFIEPQYRTYKSSNGDIAEVKLKEFEDMGSSKKRERPADIVCGPERSATYLDFQAFDYKLSNDDARHYGNYTWEIRELLMAGYIRINTNKTIAPGRKLSDIDAFEKTLYETRLSFIENLDDVADWHIEDFQLDYEDFNLSADNAEMLTSIDEQFRGLMKAVTSTLGDDIITYEKNEDVNIFPGFPDRVSSVNAFATMKVQQFFMVQEVPENV